MTCPRHAHCAFTGTEPDACPGCHASWAKITAPAEHRVAITGTNRKTGEAVSRDEITYLGGYGETKEGHEARHAVSDARNEAAAARAASVRASRARKGGSEGDPLETVSEAVA